MAAYSYKDVCYRIPEDYTGTSFQDKYGREYDDDPNYDGDCWLATSDWIDDLESHIDNLQEKIKSIEEEKSQ